MEIENVQLIKPFGPLVMVAHTWKGRSEFEDQKVAALNDLGYAALSIDLSLIHI